MYKVLLVDDEMMALEGLKYVLDWEMLGFSICAACVNGQEAVQAIEEYNPDVVITDIRMPVLGGLDLIKYAKEHGKGNIKFIVVSGYGEFEYAKKAMEYAVRYYLQKPVFEEEIIEVIMEIKKQLDRAFISKNSEEMDKKAVLNGVLSNIIRGNDVQEGIEHLKNYIGESMLHREWNCIAIELESPETSAADNQFKEARLEVRKAIDKIVKSSKGIYILEQSPTMFIILTNICDKLDNDNPLGLLVQNIHQEIISVFSRGLTMTIGESVSELNNIKHCYDTAIEALKHRFYSNLNSIILYNEIKEKSFRFQFNEVFMSSKIIEAVEELNNDKVKDIIAEIFQYFECNRIDPDIVVMFTSNMICKISNLKDHTSSDTANNIICNYTIREFKKQERTMKALKSFFEDFCLEYCEYNRKICSKNSESNIDKIEAFIKDNYKRNITIRELAEKVYMHPVYLGQLINRKFGMGFNEYIHECRIKEAKRLMTETKFKNNEIAEQLGYCNYNSFLQQFQKLTGMKPSEFKNANKTIIEKN